MGGAYKSALTGTTESDFELGPGADYGIKRSGDQQLLRDVETGEHPLRDYLNANNKRIPCVFFREAPTENGTIHVVGSLNISDTDVALASGTPIDASHDYHNSRCRIVVASASGAPFTIRVTGISVSLITGGTTVDDTEDVSISDNGSYMTEKYWLDAPNLAILEASKSCTVTLTAVWTWDFGDQSLTIIGTGLMWEPDAGAWSVQLKVIKVDNDGLETEIQNVTKASTDIPPWTENGHVGRYCQHDHDEPVDGTAGEGLVIEVIQEKILNFQAWVGYE